ncbi:MAG: hypothetical protein QM736_15850 [Vicinamibacterales bacterium]
MGRIVRRRFTAVGTFLVAWLVILDGAGGARAERYGTDLREGRRANPLPVVRRVPPARLHRADVAHQVRRGSSLGPFHPHAHHQS